jgi:hypothetical protein
MRASTATVRAVSLAGLLNALDAALPLALLPLAVRHWGSDEAGYGLAVAVLGFGALAAPLLWWLGRTASSRARCGFLLFCAALGSVTLSPALMWAVLPLAVAGAATVHVEGALTETIQDAVPDAARAGVLGLTDSVMVGAALVGSLVTPWLAATLGARQVVALLAAVSLAGALVVEGRKRARRPTPAIPEQRRPLTQPAVRVDV